MPRPTIAPDTLAMLLEAASCSHETPLFLVAKAAVGKERAEELELCVCWLEMQMFEADAAADVTSRALLICRKLAIASRDPWPVATMLLRRWPMRLPLAGGVKAN